MIYTDLTKLALRIAYQAHHGQEDKGHTPYFCHVFHVAEQMENEDQTVTALLHDVVEDTEETIESLREKGIPENILRKVALLSRKESENYDLYIDRIIESGDPDVLRVKYEDLCHNLDESRTDKGQLPQKLLDRYTRSRKKIQAALS